MESLYLATCEEMEKIEGFGAVMAQSVVDYFSIEQNRLLIEELASLGIKMSANEEAKGNLFDKKIFVLTGTLPSLTRQQATEIIEKQGGKVSSSVSKKTSFVLSGEDAGSKLTKARNLNVKIISENEFFKMLEQN